MAAMAGYAAIGAVLTGAVGWRYPKAISVVLFPLAMFGTS